MKILEFKQLLINKCGLRPGGHGVWWRAQVCPFCGNNKWKFYLYINSSDDSSVGYDCKRCNRKGYTIDESILNSLGINGVSIPKFKGVKAVKQNGELYTDINLLPDDSDISKIQNYIYSRLKVIPTFDELKKFMYVADPIQYLKMISDNSYNPNMFINRFCFKLTNGALTCRYHNDTNTRWIKHSVNKNAGCGLYIIRSEFDPSIPINVCISEGVFDAIGLYYHGDINNGVYISTQGTNYAAGIKHVIDTGIFGKHVNVGIYKDANVKNREIIYNKKYKKLFKSITIYENVIESDYGYPKDKIEIHKAL